MTEVNSMPIPPISFPETLDNTTISSFARCPRSFFWGHLLHLQPAHASIHLHAGKAYATLCEVFRKSYYTPDTPTYHDKVASLTVATRAFFLSYGFDPEQENQAAWLTTSKQANRMLECFLAMLEEYPPATDPIHPYMINNKPAVELSFSIPLNISHPDTGDPILFHGRFDMLAEYNGKIFVFDDKTTSSLGPQWNKQWEFRSQFTGYCLGAQTFSVPVAGAIVRGHCILKRSFKFAQPITYRKEFQMQQWWRDLHFLAHQMIDAYRLAKKVEARHGCLAGTPYFPSMGTFNEACNAYSGCDFRELCGTKHPSRWIPDYRIRIWDPKNPDANSPKRIDLGSSNLSGELC